ncbi:hypothetical protein Tco_1403183 [Tanacetum coccineum]
MVWPISGTLYNAMCGWHADNSGPENSIILRVKGVFNVSLKGLLRSSSPISFPFQQCDLHLVLGETGGVSSISKFSRNRVSFVSLVVIFDYRLHADMSFDWFLLLEGSSFSNRRAPPELPPLVGLSILMQRGFLSQKEGRGGRGVKEKQHSSAKDTTQVTGEMPSVTDGPVLSRSCGHTVDENVGQTPVQ